MGDRFDRPRVMLVSALVTTSLVALLVTLPMSALFMVITLVALGFFQCLARPCLDAMISEVSIPGNSGSTFGLVFGIVSLGGATSGPLVSYLTDSFLCSWALV